MMTWREHERQEQRLRDEAERLDLEELDRKLNPQAWVGEIPAIWNRGDLYEGDQRRDGGKC